MSSFWEEDAQETLDTFEEVGEPVIYRPKDLPSVETMGVSSLEQNLSGGNNPASIGELSLLRAKVGVPKYGDLVVLDGRQWRVIRILRSDPNVVTVEIRNDERTIYR